MDRISLLSPYPAVVFAVLAGSALIWAYLFRHSWWRLVSTSVLAVVAAAASIGAGVNAYVGYFRTVGQLFGETATLAVSRTESDHLIAQASTQAAGASDQPAPGAGGALDAGGGQTSGEPQAPGAQGAKNEHLPEQGAVLEVTIPAPRSGWTGTSAQVYVPPAWFKPVKPRLPVVLMLGGTPGTQYDWTRAADADVVADRWARSHDGYAPILVMPQINVGFSGDTECVDGVKAKAETWLAEDVVSWVQRTLNPSTNFDQWAVAGASEGGYCAVMLAMRHHEIFHTFLDISGLDRPSGRGIFGGDGSAYNSHIPSVILKDDPAAAASLHGCLVVGSADPGSREAATRLTTLFSQVGLDSQMVTIHGMPHTWNLFRTGFEATFPWLATRVAAGAAPSYVPNCEPTPS